MVASNKKNFDPLDIFSINDEDTFKLVHYFRFLKQQQEEKRLKKEKRLKAQEERELNEEQKKRLKEKNKVVKILTFVVQLIMASAVVLITIYFIF